MPRRTVTIMIASNQNAEQLHPASSLVVSLTAPKASIAGDDSCEPARMAWQLTHPSSIEATLPAIRAFNRMPADPLRRLRAALKSSRRWLRSSLRTRTPRRLRRGISAYRGARRSLHAPVSRQSRRGLDWMNFFLADVQTGFGSFVAFYLADLGWSKAQVGLALTTGTLAGMVGQIPGGAFTDAFRWKRALAAAGIVMIAASALILALVPTFPLVFLAEILHGLTAGIVTPAIAAISLGLVGRRAMSVRTGRNYRFDAAGNALTAGLMGLAGQYFAKSAIFLGAAALCIPALIALSRIRGDEIDYSRARNAGIGKQAKSFQRIFDLGKNPRLYIFAGCVFLFQFADASMLP